MRSTGLSGWMGTVSDSSTGGPGAEPTDGETRHIVVIGPDGQPIGVVPSLESGADNQSEESAESSESVTELVEQPAKVMRIGSMIKQLLDEVRSAPLDEAGRRLLSQIHARSIKELEDGLAPELVEELDRLSLPFSDDAPPTEAELRIAQAQLVGWLEGLFHGIQTALFAQQMAARAQFEEMRRRALPAGHEAGPTVVVDERPPKGGSGPYL